MDPDDTRRATIEVAREELDVRREKVDTGVVHVRTVTSEQLEKVSELAMQEEALVDRVPVHRIVDAPFGSREEGDVTVIPVFEEILTVQRQWRLKEEVRITRRRIQVPFEDEVVLRKQSAVVERLPAQEAQEQDFQPSIGEREMAKTVIGLIDTPQETQSVVQDLMREGFPRDRIGLMASDRKGTATTTATKRSKKVAKDDDTASGVATGAGTGAAIGGIAGLALSFSSLAIPGIGPILAAGPIAAALTGAGIGAVAGGLIGGLTHLGVPEDEAHYYAEGVRRGGTLVTVTTETDQEVERAVATMKRHGAVDIEERAASWKKQGWAGRFEAKEGTEGTIPVVQEDLVVGKRQATKGGVRVYSHVTEQPVQERVNLREEHATIERRPVDRPLGANDAAAFRDRTVEVRETAEQPVVGKRARVVEEVSVGKEQTQHQETINDTVRKTDVNVERMSGSWSGVERRRQTNVPYTGMERRKAA